MAACKIGNTEYNTLSDAITAATENATITLLDNVTEDVSINGKSITIDLNGKILSGNITISSGSLTIDEQTLSVSQGSATANFVDGSLTTVTGSDDADIITGNFNHVTILGGKGNDTIENGGNSSVSIDGGEGNNLIKLTENYDADAMETAINVSKGNDTINVGSNVQKFSVTGFDVGDKFHFEAGSISAAEYDNDALNVTLTVDKNVTVNGMTTPTATVDNKWLSVSGSAATYGKTSGTESVQSGNDFSLESVAGETYFTIGGLNNALTVESLNGNDSPVTVDSKTVTLGAGALDTQNVTISGDDYKLTLAADVDTVQDTLDGWHSTGSNLAYFEGRRGDYFSLSDDSLSVTYHASVEGTKQVELSNITGTPTLDATTVKLTANNFSDDTVSVVSNAGDYKFSLSGDFNQKSFTGTSGSDSIISSGNNVSINGGLGNDTINLTGGEGVTVNVNSGDDLISVGSAVTSFTVQDFKAGDLIKLTNAVDSLSIDSGKLKAGSVTVNGIDSVVTAQNDWSVGTGSIIYRGWTNN